MKLSPIEVLDEIIESASEFIRDDGPYESFPHMEDMIAAKRIRDLLTDESAYGYLLGEI